MPDETLHKAKSFPAGQLEFTPTLSWAIDARKRSLTEHRHSDLSKSNKLVDTIVCRSCSCYRRARRGGPSACTPRCPLRERAGPQRRRGPSPPSPPGEKSGPSSLRRRRPAGRWCCALGAGGTAARIAERGPDRATGRPGLPASRDARLEPARPLCRARPRPPKLRTASASSSAKGRFGLALRGGRALRAAGSSSSADGPHVYGVTGALRSLSGSRPTIPAPRLRRCTCSGGSGRRACGSGRLVRRFRPVAWGTSAGRSRSNASSTQRAGS
ncbi:SH2 domain-containing adapter protein B-like [Equus przewalskii]|uniref:SH2 domain-containing adapter protein B-like n=1 Tax=Equus przewalskii TaxID=9798 RepID=A0ABM4LCT7_EQUPR